MDRGRKEKVGKKKTMKENKEKKEGTGWVGRLQERGY
jgi:hypothetical protein